MTGSGSPLGQPAAAEWRIWRWRILVSTWLAYAGFYFCRKAFYVVKKDLGDELQLDATALGEIGMAYLIAYTLGQFLSAGLGSRTGPRILLLIGMAVSVGCNVAFGFANNYWTLLAFMALNGFAQATGWPSVIGTLAHWTRREERGWLLGLWGTCYQLGGVAAKVWAAFWLARQGWRGAFFAASVVLAAVWVFVWLYQRNKPEDVGLEAVASHGEGGSSDDDKDEDAGWTSQLITTVMLVGCFYFGVKFVRYALWSWTPYFLQKNYGLAGDDAGYLSTVFDLAGFAGVITAGFVSDKLFESRRAKVAFLMLLGMLGSCGLMVTIGATSVPAFALSLAIVGFMLYGPDSLLTGAGAIDVGSRKTAVAAAGIINGMGSMGSVVQETVVARVYEASDGQMTPVFVTLFVAAAMSVSALAVVLGRNRRGLSDL
jgi:sugar phosphate permease